MFPDVVILAGGLGTRLAQVTGSSQKVLAKVNEQPFLEILIDYIASQGGRRFILCLGHGRDDVMKHFKDRYKDREIIFSYEDSPLGTGGGIKQAARYVRTEQFLAMNGDCFCVIDYHQLMASHATWKAKATLVVTQVADAHEYGTIEISSKGTIKAFKEKQPQACAAFVNTGTYCFDYNIFSLVNTPDKFSIEYDFFPHLVGQGFYAFKVENRFIDIGTPDRYHRAQEYIQQWRQAKRAM